MKASPFLPTLTPEIMFEDSALRRANDKMLAHIRKRYGEMGSPCLSPVPGLKELDMLPLKRRV